MTQVNTILEELRKELGEAMHLVVTSCGDVREHWTGRRDALIQAIEIVEKAAAPESNLADEIRAIVRDEIRHMVNRRAP